MKFFGLVFVSFISINNLFADPAEKVQEAPNEICKQPVSYLGASTDMLLNLNTSHEDLKGRYLVADLNLKNSEGKCKGVEEILPSDKLGVTFGSAMKIAPDKNGCSGQSVNLCEYKDGEYKLIAKFALSAVAKNRLSKYAGYYAPINYMNTRHGDKRAQTAEMKLRDEYMGGGDEKLLMYEGSDPMYNFLNFRPADGFRGETQNGIHRYPSGTEGNLGSPASHGCMRISKNGTRYIREWTPVHAKFFIIHSTVEKIK